MCRSRHATTVATVHRRLPCRRCLRHPFRSPMFPFVCRWRCKHRQACVRSGSHRRVMAVWLSRSTRSSGTPRLLSTAETTALLSDTTRLRWGQEHARPILARTRLVACRLARRTSCACLRTTPRVTPWTARAASPPTKRPVPSRCRHPRSWCLLPALHRSVCRSMPHQTLVVHRLRSTRSNGTRWARKLFSPVVCRRSTTRCTRCRHSPQLRRPTTLAERSGCPSRATRLATLLSTRRRIPSARLWKRFPRSARCS